MNSSKHAIAARPFHVAAGRARFVAGVGVAVTGAALWLADLSHHLVA
jgi:hypothetical protein